MATQEQQKREARWDWTKRQITAMSKAILDLQSRMKAIEDLIYETEPEIEAGEVTEEEMLDVMADFDVRR